MDGNNTHYSLFGSYDFLKIIFYRRVGEKQKTEKLNYPKRLQ